MIDDWRKFFSFFQALEKRRIVVLLICTTLNGLMEAVGVASILPFIAVVADPSLVSGNQYLSRVYTLLEFSSTNQFLVFLGVAALLVLVATNVLAGVNAWLHFASRTSANTTSRAGCSESISTDPTSSCCGATPRNSSPTW